jgi:O-antigen/teichoic acid export membrane protein
MHKLFNLYSRLRDDEKIVLIGTLWTTLIRGMGMGIGYVSLVLLARWMGAEQFGIYAYVFAAITTLAILPLFGLSYASIPFIAEYEVNKDFDKLRGLLLFATGFVIIMSLIVSFVFSELVQQNIINLGAYKEGIIVGCMALPVFSLLSYMGEVSRGLGRAIAAFAPLQVMVPLLFLLFAYLTYYYLNDLDSTRAIRLWFFAMLLFAAIHILYIWMIVGKRFPGGARSYDLERWLGTSAHFLLISVTIAVLFQMDVLILGIFLQPEFVGYYSAAARTALLVTVVLQAINTLGARQYATLYNRGKIDELQTLLRSLSRWIIWATACISILLVLGGSYVLSIFGSDYTQAYPSLIILTFGYACSVVFGPVTVLLQVTGYQKVTARVLTFAVIMGIILNTLLIPTYGMVGAASAMAVTAIYWSQSLHWHVRKILGLETCILFVRS